MVFGIIAAGVSTVVGIALGVVAPVVGLLG